MIKCLLPRPADRVAALKPFSVYRHKEGIDELVLAVAPAMPAHCWLDSQLLLPQCAQLRTLAIKVFAQVASASACGRNFQYVCSKRRNKLTVAKAEDLVYVHSTLRLQRSRLHERDEGIECFVLAGSGSDDE